MTACGANDKEQSQQQSLENAEEVVGAQHTHTSTHTSTPKPTPSSSPKKEDAVVEDVSESIEPSETDIFTEYSLSEELTETYYRFKDYYSPEEYVNICEIAESISAKPEKAINSKLYIVYQDNSTYNAVSTRHLIIDIFGNIVKAYSDNGWGPQVYTVGDFAFVSGQSHCSGIHLC